MTDTVLGYLVSLGVIGAGVVWIVAGTIYTASDLCIADTPSHSRMDEQIAVQKGNCHFTDSRAFAFLQERDSINGCLLSRWLPYKLLYSKTLQSARRPWLGRPLPEDESEDRQI
jgi:hypothetical protein